MELEPTRLLRDESLSAAEGGRQYLGLGRVPKADLQDSRSAMHRSCGGRPLPHTSFGHLPTKPYKFIYVERDCA